MGMQTSFPNSPFSFGFGGRVVTGQSLYVSSTASNASNGNTGKSPRKPLATLDYAVGLCNANEGDVIYMMPGHVETVTAAGGLDLDVAGISIIGIGNGSNRPTVNLTTATTADVDVDAANITIENILFTGGIDALAAPLDINAADCTIRNCEFRDVTGQATLGILTDANCNRFLLEGYRHDGAAAAGANAAVRIVGGDGIVIRDFWINGNFAVAAIENVTTAATNITIGGGRGSNYIWTQNAADVAVTLVSTSTGFVGPNINAQLTDNAANITEAFVGAAAVFFQPINIVNLAGESSMQTNITASTDA